jgi:hypothetical protein
VLLCQNPRYDPQQLMTRGWGGGGAANMHGVVAEASSTCGSHLRRRSVS